MRVYSLIITALILFFFHGKSHSGAVFTEKLWPAGSNLTIGFFNGNEAQRQAVMDGADEWSRYGNISFTRGNVSGADIRVRFETTGSSLSAIGTDANSRRSHEHTMRLVISSDPNELQGEFARRRILHELGHALAFVHEHQSPSIDLCWNESAVITELQAQGFSIDQIYAHFLTVYSRMDVTTTTFDPNSIMLFPLPRRFFTCNLEFNWNTQLSTLDKELMAQVYPATNTQQPGSGNNNESNGGGGCTYVEGSPFDPTMPLSILLAGLYLWRRRLA